MAVAPGKAKDLVGALLSNVKIVGGDSVTPFWASIGMLNRRLTRDVDEESAASTSATAFFQAIQSLENESFTKTTPRRVLLRAIPERPTNVL
jgi:hypothetical protein